VEALQKLIFGACAGSEGFGESALLANVRHIESVRDAAEAVSQAAQALREGFPPDVAATDIRRAWHALGQITGKTVDEDVIDLIFEKFCLGK
jgi:tRNA modification GTPase